MEGEERGQERGNNPRANPDPQTPPVNQNAAQRPWDGAGDEAREGNQGGQHPGNGQPQQDGNALEALGPQHTIIDPDYTLEEGLRLTDMDNGLDIQLTWHRHCRNAENPGVQVTREAFLSYLADKKTELDDHMLE